MYNLEDWGTSDIDYSTCPCCGYERTYEKPLCPKTIEGFRNAVQAINKKIFEAILKASKENNEATTN